MAVHDDYARVTPYELLFPSPEFPDERFPAVLAEAEARGIDLGNPAAFAMAGAVQGALAELRPDDAANGNGPAAGPGGLDEASLGHVQLLFFAFHFWRVERTSRQTEPARPALALVRTATLRALLAGGPQRPGWEAVLRGRAGYIQLPQHLAWIDDPDGGAPESVDGFFWIATRDDAFHAAAVTGVRPDRPGCGLVPTPPTALEALSSWTTGQARESGDEFATTLPGAELDGLLGIRTPAEVFKLLAFALERWTKAADLPAKSPATAPSASSPELPPASPANPRPTSPAPAPSRLPHLAV